MTLRIIPLLFTMLSGTIILPAQNVKPEKKTTTVESSKILMVLDITVHDTAMYEQYRENVEPLIKKYGGRYLVRSGGMAFDKDPDRKVIPVQGNWNPNRFIIVQWDSVEQLQKFSTSAAYMAISKLRENSAFTKSIIVKEYPAN